MVAITIDDDFHPERFFGNDTIKILDGYATFRFDSKWLGGINVCIKCLRLLDGAKGQNFKNACPCPAVGPVRATKQQKEDNEQARNKRAR